MQHSQRELSIPFVSSFNIQKALVRAYSGLILQIILFIAGPVAIIAIFTNMHVFSNMHGDAESNAVLFLLFLSLVILPGYGIWGRFKYLKILRRRQRAPAEALRVNQEGIYFSTWIFWKEIEAIFLYTVTFRGKDHTVIGIVPRDYQAISSRFVRERSSGLFSRLVMWGTSYWVLHDSRFLAPINITQERLPLSVETLMEEIRTHFAAELEAYRIRCSL